MQTLVSQAYGEIQHRTAAPRDVEFVLFERFTEALEEINAQEQAPIAAYSNAIVKNMDLWSRLTIDLAGEDNQLPLDTRQSLIGIAEFVRKESMKRLSSRGDLTDLIEVNRNIMPGLRAAA